MTVHTITFYSYKGGVGRTLAVANIAKYLARLGQVVFAIDFDLEAPGLHHKLGLDPSAPADFGINAGLTDFIMSFQRGRKVPQDLQPYVVHVDAKGATTEMPGQLFLMPAGKAPGAAYWEELSRIDWHRLFYADSGVPSGIPLFLELKELIRDQYRPDFLLIDARTGITEIGGIATAYLAETVVCLIMNNRENLEGNRSVLRSILRTARMEGREAPKLKPVLTRVPKRRASDRDEQTLVARARAFLEQPPEDLSDTLDLGDILILHSDADLELEERLVFGTSPVQDESALLRDYLQLFSHIVPSEAIAGEVEPIVEAACAEVFDDPETTQRQLETVAKYSGHPAAFRALVKLYRLRDRGDAALGAAIRLWQCNPQTEDDKQLVWGVVAQYFPNSLRYARPRVNSSIVYEIWSWAGSNHSEVGLALIESLEASDARFTPLAVAEELYKASEEPSSAVVSAYARLSEQAGNYVLAVSIARRYLENCEVLDERIATQLVTAVSGSKDPTLAGELLMSPPGVFEYVQRERPVLAFEVLQILGREAEGLKDMEVHLHRLLGRMQRDARLSQALFTSAEDWSRVNRLEDFLELLENVSGTDPFVADALMQIQRRLGVKGRRGIRARAL